MNGGLEVAHVPNLLVFSNLFGHSPGVLVTDLEDLV